jgi:hypothetical protein
MTPTHTTPTTPAPTREQLVEAMAKAYLDRVFTTGSEGAMNNTISITCQQGGTVGIKDMLVDGVQRLSVAGVNSAGSVYLTREECITVANALTSERESGSLMLTDDERADVLRGLRLLREAFLCEQSFGWTIASETADKRSWQLSALIEKVTASSRSLPEAQP